jgi:5-methylcytosine-specific restriction endonuclease McrA
MTRHVLPLTNGRYLDSVVEARRVRLNNLRASELGLVADLSPAHWLMRLFAYDFRCAYCGRPYETMDHTLPLSSGGATTYYNVLPCCADCNKAKGAAVWLPANCGR